ncbi:MAG: c-type cytochrome [Alphaproteobacteria bacterium]|nr:c-type cytochrome [Alphaproteobacteria bacterium]
MANMKIKLAGVIAGVCASVALSSPAAWAQDVAIGKEQFRLRCAVCHGMGGLGDGPVGNMLKTPAPNLALLAERNGGAFPFQKVYDIIDGRANIAAHGNRDMPIWGDFYRGEALPTTPVPDNATERMVDAPERIVESRILALVYYIGTLQTSSK